MDLKKLGHAVVLEEERNFARAAARVHITQSALSRSIQALEAELGVRLFDRDLTGVALTPIGEELVRRGRELLLHARTVRREVDLLRVAEMGNVALGAGPFPGATLLPPVLAQLTREHPAVRVEVELNNWAYLLEHLLDERIEFFVSDSRSLAGDGRVAIMPLARQFGGFFCRRGHPLAGPELDSAEVIAGYPLASVVLPESIRYQLKAFFRIAQGSELPISVSCDNPALLAHVSLNSDAIVLTTPAAIAEELRMGEMVEIRVCNAPAFYTDMGVVTLAGRSLSPGAAWIIDKLRRLAQPKSQA